MVSRITDAIEGTLPARKEAGGADSPARTSRERPTKEREWSSKIGHGASKAERIEASLVSPDIEGYISDALRYMSIAPRRPRHEPFADLLQFFEEDTRTPDEIEIEAAPVSSQSSKDREAVEKSDLGDGNQLDEGKKALKECESSRSGGIDEHGESCEGVSRSSVDPPRQASVDNATSICSGELNANVKMGNMHQHENLKGCHESATVEKKNNDDRAGVFCQDKLAGMLYESFKRAYTNAKNFESISEPALNQATPKDLGVAASAYPSTFQQSNSSTSFASTQPWSQVGECPAPNMPPQFGLHYGAATCSVPVQPCYWWQRPLNNLNSNVLPARPYRREGHPFEFREPILDCPVCLCMFTTYQRRDAHLRKHAERTPHVCARCLASVGEEKKMFQHLKSHLMDWKLSCEPCQRSFRSNSQFLTHRVDEECRATSLGENNRKARNNLYSCARCPQLSLSAINMAYHQGSHDGYTPYLCFSCDKTFESSAEVIAHQREHLQRAMYRCPGCDVKFSYQKDLTKHAEMFGAMERVAEFLTNRFRMKPTSHQIPPEHSY